MASLPTSQAALAFGSESPPQTDAPGAEGSEAEKDLPEKQAGTVKWLESSYNCTQCPNPILCETQRSSFA